MKHIRYISLLVIALGFFSGTAFATDKIEFTASADRAVVLGQNFRLSYSINERDAENLQIPAIEDFRILSGPNSSTSQSTQYINGKMTSSYKKTYTYILLAQTEGEFTIPAATIEIKGRKYESNSVSIKVLPPDKTQQSSNTVGTPGSNQQSNQQNNSKTAVNNKDLFMTASLDKKVVYEQEPILLSFKIYSRVNLTNLSKPFPDMQNFHTQEIELPDMDFELEHYNGLNYQSRLWSQYVLFPQKSGELEIPATTFEAYIHQPIESNDIFDIFMNSRYVEVQKNLTTPAIKINVRPLPAGKTDAFYGGVGHFSISSTCSATKVKTGDALTLRIIVSGTGNLKLIKTPVVNLPKDFEIYDPKIENKFSLKPEGQTGNKVFEYLFVPQYPGTYTIPSVEFQYFDTKIRQYRTISTQEITLEVERGSNAVSASNSNTQPDALSGYISQADLKFVGQDVRFHLNNGKLLDINNLFYGSARFHLLLILPVLLLIAFVILYDRQRKQNANVVVVRKKRANSMAAKRLKTANNFMQNNRSAEFYDAVLGALWGYVSDKLSIPTSQLSKENAMEELRNKHVHQNTIEELMTLIDNCQFARYAPQAQNVNLQDVYNNAISIISKIDEEIK